MKNNDNLLKKHSLIEVKYGDMFTSVGFINEGFKRMINESGGIMNGMDMYLSAIENTIKEDIKNINILGNFTFVYYSDIFPFETFFDSCEITVNIHLNSGDIIDCSGGYRSGQSGSKSIDNYFIKIRLDIYGTKNSVPNTIRVAFAHELTHAYDDYCRRRLIKNKKDELKQSGDDIFRASHTGGLYKASKGASDANEISTIYNLIYFTSKIEINGYIGEMKEELREYFRNNEIQTSNDIFDSIKCTNVYDIIKKYEEEVALLKEIAYECNTSHFDDIKKRLIDTYNNINSHSEVIKNTFNIQNKPIRTIKQLYKLIYNKFKRLKMRFYSRAPRIAYEVYMEQFENTSPNENMKGKTINEMVEHVRKLIQKIDK